MALGFGALAFADDLAFYLGAAVVWTVGSMLAAPPNAQINADLAPPQLRARYQSVFYLTFPAAAFVAPTLGGVSLQHLGERHWLVVGALGLVAAVGHLLAGPPRERRVAALRPASPRRGQAPRPLDAPGRSGRALTGIGRKRQSAHHDPGRGGRPHRAARRRRATLTPVSVARSRRRFQTGGHRPPTACSTRPLAPRLVRGSDRSAAPPNDSKRGAVQ